MQPSSCFYQLPSWVPDFSISRFERGTWTWKRYHASLNGKSRARISEEGKLVLQGYEMDTISAIHASFPSDFNNILTRYATSSDRFATTRHTLTRDKHGYMTIIRQWIAATYDAIGKSKGQAVTSDEVASFFTELLQGSRDDELDRLEYALFLFSAGSDGFGMPLAQLDAIIDVRKWGIFEKYPWQFELFWKGKGPMPEQDELLQADCLESKILIGSVFKDLWGV